MTIRIHQVKKLEKSILSEFLIKVPKEGETIHS
jgi:hypothetical protein